VKAGTVVDPSASTTVSGSAPRQAAINVNNALNTASASLLMVGIPTLKKEHGSLRKTFVQDSLTRNRVRTCFFIEL